GGRVARRLWVSETTVWATHRRLAQGLVSTLRGGPASAPEPRRIGDEAAELVAVFNPQLAARLDEPAARLAMIDRRRVEICRALISRPRLLLLDEPSAGMTHEETRELMDDILVVRERMSGLTIVIIEQEMGVIERITDRCVVLNYGRKISEGKFAQIAADRQVQEAYLGVA